MRADELYKFRDGTLKNVRDKMDYMLDNFELGYNDGMLKRAWTEKDKKRTTSMLEKIEKTLMTRRIIRSLKYVIFTPNFCWPPLPKHNNILRLVGFSAVQWAFGTKFVSSGFGNLVRWWDLRRNGGAGPVPAEPPDWNDEFKDPKFLLVVDIGSAKEHHEMLLFRHYEFVTTLPFDLGNETLDFYIDTSTYNGFDDHGMIFKALARKKPLDADVNFGCNWKE
ncbi:hypothetical protein Tco_1507207 [Tanacetum coccineum]